MDENKRLKEMNEKFLVPLVPVYLLLMQDDYTHDNDEWLGIFNDILALKKAYEEAKTHPDPDWYKFLKPFIYEFPLNTPVKIMDSEKYIRSVSEAELNALAEAEQAKRGETDDHGRTGTDVG